MSTLKVENIGMSSGKDYDFYSGQPAFIESGDELIVAINNGSSLTSATVPMDCEGIKVTEILNPPYTVFKNGDRGAVYRITTESGTYMVNLTFDGFEVVSEKGESNYYVFDVDYEDLVELSEFCGEDVEALMVALGF